MILAVPKETREQERRVAATPDTVRKFLDLGFSVVVEQAAGEGAMIPDETFVEAGAALAKTPIDVYGSADIVLRVQCPLPEETALMKRGSLLVGMLAPHRNRDIVETWAQAGIIGFAMELMPRITRAQSMDVLSSQSNLAGYKAVIDAAAAFNRAMPMMMTAAGTIVPARVMVLGAGVAGLQAIATARRLGAIVCATDVRPAAREQVESLGATFVMVESEETKEAETAGGYAKEMSDEYKRKQAELVAETLKKQDMAICTALIPGKTAPVLITEAMVRSMKPGSIIVDLAVEQGGNCALSIPGEAAEINGVKILGYFNVPSRLARDASALYARNLLNFVTPLVDRKQGRLNIDWEDEIVRGTALTKDGAVINPALRRGT